MKSVFWLIADSVAGRPGPKKAPWVLEEFRAAGFDTVLNLSGQEPDYPAFERVGLQVAWIPLPSEIPPNEDSEIRFEEALPRAYDFLTTQIAAGRRVLVHCYSGRDRTGMLFALLLAKRGGLSVREAILKVREVRPIAITADGWEDLALRVIPRLISKA
jgi:protein-tyrosine phosphatase